MVLEKHILSYILWTAVVTGYVAFASEFIPLLEGRIQGVSHYFSLYEVPTCAVIGVSYAVFYAGRTPYWRIALAALVSLVLLWALRYVVFFAVRSILGIWVAILLFLGPPSQAPWHWYQWVHAVIYSIIMYVIGAIAGAGVSGTLALLLFRVKRASGELA